MVYIFIVLVNNVHIAYISCLRPLTSLLLDPKIWRDRHKPTVKMLFYTSLSAVYNGVSIMFYCLGLTPLWTNTSLPWLVLRFLFGRIITVMFWGELERSVYKVMGRDGSNFTVWHSSVQEWISAPHSPISVWKISFFPFPCNISHSHFHSREISIGKMGIPSSHFRYGTRWWPSGYRILWSTASDWETS